MKRLEVTSSPDAHSSFIDVEMKSLQLIFLCIYLKSSEAFNKLLLGSADVNCSDLDVIGQATAAQKFFETEHSLILIDYSMSPIASSLVCSKGRVGRAYEVFDSLGIMKFGKEIDKSGLSEYPLTHGIHVKGSLKDATEILPTIAKFNPRLKLMIHLTDGCLQKVEKILFEGFRDHKMLDVAATMFHNQTITFCLYNPFAGSRHIRQPELKCWNMTRITNEEQILEIKSFIAKRIRNLQKYPLKIAIYHQPMLASPVKDKDGKIRRYQFPDGDFAHQLSQRFNFTPIYFHTGGDIKQGQRLANGSFTGSLGMIESGGADYSANAVLISSSYNTTNVLFITTMAMEQFMFIIQKRDSSNNFGNFVMLQFDRTSILMFVVLTFAFPILYTIIAKLESKFLRIKSDVKFSRNIFYIIALQLNVTMQHTSLHASRLVVASILFLTLIMNSIFQGTIVSSLNNNQDNGTMKTMDELIANNYQLLIHYDTKPVLICFGGRWQQIASDPKSIVLNSSAGFNIVKANKGVAVLTSKLYSGNYLEQYFDPETGENLIQEVPEVLFEFYMSPTIPKTSPFIEQFKEFSLRYREFGLRRYQTRRASADKNRYMIQRLRAGNVPKRKDKTIELNDLWTVFQLYLLLNGIALVAFVVEYFNNLIGTKITSKKNNRRPAATFPLYEFVL